MKSRAQTATNSNDVLPLRLAHAAAISHKPQEPKTITHNDENLLWYWLWQVVLQYGICFNELVITILRNSVSQNRI